jgi:hypothetical protein
MRAELAIVYRKVGMIAQNDYKPVKVAKTTYPANAAVYTL